MRMRWLWIVCVLFGCSTPPTLEAASVCAHFDGATSIAIGDARFTLGLSAIGRDGAMREATSYGAHRVGGETRITRAELPGITEWWRSDQRGLEHGVTIAERPEGDGALRLSLAVDGSTPRTLGPTSIALGDRAQYSGLVVFDADGARVDATMAAIDREIRITVDDADAHYPLVIDPLVFAVEQTLPPSSATTTAGTSVSITPDGTRVVIGEPGASPSSGQGTVYVRAATGTTWTLEGSLTVPTAAAGARVGASVSICADGSVTAVASGSNSYVFRRAGASWTLGETLAGLSAHGPQSIAISPDCNYLYGASSVFHWTGSAWTSVATVTALGLTTSGAWSGDGTRLAVGSTQGGGAGISCGSMNGVTPGMVNIYLAPTFALEATVTPGAYGSQFGIAVALDGSGTWLAAGSVGGSQCTAPRATYFYSRTGTTWTRSATVTTPTTQLTITADGAIAYGTGGSGGGLGGSTMFSFARMGSVWMLDSSFTAPAAALGVSTTATGSRIALGSGGATQILHVGLRNGDACTSTSDCQSSFCVDGFCCDTACGGGYDAAGTNCSACANTYTGGNDGTCAALDANYASRVTCRASAGPCDVAEQCTTALPSCPSDALAPNTMTCRASAGQCDVAETCTGSSASCPADVLLAAGTQCRVLTGLCDSPFCTGTDPACPQLTVQPSTHVCATSMGPCELDTHCDGLTTACPTRNYMAAGTVCHTSVGVCDSTTMCSGSSAMCPPNLLHGVVCRGPAGACDVAESCTGADPNCPPDAVEGGGTVCRASTATCDPAESCDGTSTSCPPDVTTCTAMPDMGIAAQDAGTTAIDAGADASNRDASSLPRDASGMGTDVGSASGDAGNAPPPAAGGCGCRASGRGDGWLAICAALAVLVVKRRRSPI
jgi:hypothetical protein